MNRNSATQIRAGSKEHYLSELQRNPDDPQTLVRLIRSLRKSDTPFSAIKFLKQLITSPDFSKRSDTFRATAIQCIYNTFITLADKELEAGRIQRAEKLCGTLISLVQSWGGNLRKTGGNIQTESEDLYEQGTGKKTKVDINTLYQRTNLQAETNHPFEKLLIVLHEYGKIRYAANILQQKNCIVPYPLAISIMQDFANSMNNRKSSYIARHADLLKKFMKALDIDANQETIISQSIYSNIHYPLSPWREKALSGYDLEEMQNWIEISGIKKLQQARDKGKGIILVSCHMSTVRSLNLLLDRMGFRIISLEVRDRMGQFGIQTSNNLSVLEIGEEAEFPLRELYLVQKSLKKGGIVNLSGDGYKGTTGVSTHFLGRVREFRTSFAELAIKCEAIAFPVFGSATNSGQICLDIEKPLKPGRKTTPYKARVESLIKQYSERLEDRWKNNPGDIAWEQIRYFSSLPAIGETDTNPEENSHGL